MKIGPRLTAWGMPMRLQWRKRRALQGDELVKLPDPEVAGEAAYQLRGAIAALFAGLTGTVAFQEISAAIVATALGAAVGLACFLATMHVFRRWQWKERLGYIVAAIVYLGLGLPLVIYTTESFRPLWPRLMGGLLGF